MLETKKLKKTYYTNSIETPVLYGIDLKIDDGEFVSIIGPSGAGKSTLLYQMSLLDRPTSGMVLVDRKEISKLSEREATAFRLQYFGFVFQDYALVPELTAVENIMVTSLMDGLSAREARKVALSALERLGIAPRANNLPGQLSGGEQQRVSIARAVARKPSILFADEPTASLDSQNSEEVLRELSDLHKSGQTIIMITHERAYAERAKRIIEMHDGRIISDTKTL